MPKPREQDLLDTICVAVADALSDAIDQETLLAPPAQVVAGWPYVNELVALLSQKEYILTVFPHPDGHQTSRYSPIPFTIQDPFVSLVATVSLTARTITFSGSAQTGINVHSFIGPLLQDAYYQTRPSDTLASTATAVAAAINALTISGVSASASGAMVTVTGSPYIICNVGSSQETMAVEVNRIQRTVQVSAWCPTPDLRFQVSDPILQSIGTTDVPVLKFSDGSPLRIQNNGRIDYNTDESQSAYSLYEYHINFEVEYGILRYVRAASIGSLSNPVTITTE